MSNEGPMVDIATLMRQVEEFISSDDGVKALHRVMRRSGVAPHFDDHLAEKTSASLRTYFTKGSSITASLEGLVVATMESRTKDLLRSPRSARVRGRRTSDEGDVVDVGMDEFEDPVLDHAEGVVGRDAIAQLRHRILQADVEAWVTSAALTVIAAAHDGAAAGELCPQPAGGATVEESHRWAALWYAGRERCFESAGASAEATRKCRSRDAKVVREFMRDVAMKEGWGDGE